MFMIEANSDEKCCYTDDESYACEGEVIEYLVRDEPICHLDIPDPSYVENSLDRGRDPEYRSMYSVDQYEEKYIYEREKCHELSIGKG